MGVILLINGSLNGLLKGKKAFIFDWDGTIVYFKIDVISARREVIGILVKYGVPESMLSLDQPILKMVGKAISFIQSRDSQKFIIEKMLEEVDEAVEKYEIEAASKTSLIPGAIEVLQKLKSKGFKIGVFTLNKNSVVSSLLKRLGMNTIFDVVVARDDTTRPKPDPEHLIKTLSLLGVTAEEAIVVGDHPYDISSARSAGVKAIGVLSSGHTVEELKSAGADLVLKDISLILPELKVEKAEGD